MQRKIHKVNLGNINPAKMNDQQNWVLFHFIRSRVSDLSKGLKVDLIERQPLDANSYTISLETGQGEIEFSFKLTTEILIRGTASEPLEYRFEILNNKNDLAVQGGFGSVSSIKGTLAEELSIAFLYVHNERLIYKTNKPRVDKVQVHNKNKKNTFQESDAMNEYLLTPPHAHAKKPVFVPISNNQGLSKSHTIMRKLEDFDLADVMQKKHTISTLDELIELSIFLCMALDEQVHLYEITHRDLKPENVRVSKDLKNVKTLDFGLSLGFHQGKEIGIKRTVGTRFYFAPEQVINYKLITQKADLYSLAIMLGQLWSIANLRENYLMLGLTAANIAELHQNDPNFRPLDLKVDVYRKNKFFKDLNKDQVNLIFDLLKQATEFDPALRPEPQRMVDVFERIRIQRKCKTESLDEERQNAIWASNVSARNVRREIILMHSSAPSIAHTNKLIKKKLEALDDSAKLDCDEFLMRLGIKVLNPLKDKESIIKKLDEIENESLLNLKNLNELFDKVKQDLQGAFASPKTKDQMIRLHNKLKRDINKYSNKAADLDAINALNVRISQSLSSYHQLFDRLNLFNEAEKTEEGILAIKAAKLIEQCVKNGGKSIEIQVDMGTDFLRTLLKEIKDISDSTKILETIQKNKIDFIITLYMNDLNKLNVKFMSNELKKQFIKLTKNEFVKLAQKNIDSLADDHLVLKQMDEIKQFIIEDTRQFIFVKAMLLNNLLFQVKNEKSDKSSVSSVLESMCFKIDEANSASELNSIISDALVQINNIKPQGFFASNPLISAVKPLKEAEKELKRLLSNKAPKPKD